MRSARTSAAAMALLGLLAGCVSSPPAPVAPPAPPLAIRGRIGDDGLRTLRAALARHGRAAAPENVVVELDSDGGDIDAALAMGRLLRRASAAARISRDSRCASACVLVLAGAVGRSVEGPVQIHRPYRIEPRALGYAAAQSVFRERNRRIGEYLDEMNVPRRLLDAMIAVPPESARQLSAAELADFGLDRNDPVYEEEHDAARAGALGLPMTQYLARKRIEAEQRKATVARAP